MMLLKTFVVLAVVALTVAQRRYYSLEDMPDTNFDCRDKILGGYYADPETNCQMFHVCVKIPGQGVQDFRFLCPNETIFDQENQICADSGDIDCEASGLYLENFDLYRIGSAQAKRPVPQFGKGTPVPLGPSTKSPILTNNVYEDDDFYLQKSETGDRRSHSKDILRGSSSSNFFNNRNKGKDLEDDEEETTPRKPENQFRPRVNPPAPRPKTQFQSQFRKAEPAVTTTVQPPVDNANQLDKKRTKVAVRKLARKRPSDEVPEGRPTQPQTQQPNISAFTTQVTQKYAFGEQNGRYNTINRQQTTPTPPVTEIQKQQPQQQQQQRFPNFRQQQPQTTLAFFEPSPTAGTFSEPKVEANKGTTPFSLLRNPIVAAGPNYQNQNRGSTNFQQRPTTPVVNNQNNQNFPAPTQNYQQNFNQQANRQTTPAVNNFPQQRQNGNFQQGRQQQQPAANFQNQQGNFQNQQGNFQNQNQQQGNFQNQQQGNFQNQQQGNFQNQQAFQQGRQQQQQQPAANFQNQQQANFQNQQFQQRGQNFQNQQQFRQQTNFQTPTNFPSRQTTIPSRPPTNTQVFNNQNKQTTPQQPQRQFYNRDEFDEGDTQEFLKTAPSNNFRPSDLNSFTNNYKNENSTRFSQPTTKYYTPTIITTPKPTTYDVPTTIRQNNYYTPQVSTGQPSNFYTPTVSTTRQQPIVSSTFAPPSSKLPQRIYPSPTPAKTSEAKEPAAYDYAYYDDAGAVSEYDSLDSLGESDFSRTSQRTKARLI